MEMTRKQAKLQVAEWKLNHPERALEKRNALSPDEYEKWALDDIKSVPFALSGEQAELLWSELDFCDTLGKRVKTIRQYYILTQGEFSALLGVKQASVSRWEKDKSEPGPEIIEKLARLSESDPATIRYGRREPTSSGELVTEIPVRVIGELNVDSSIEFYEADDIVNAVERPREGRPHNDVVGIFIFLDGFFSIFQYEGWIIFYRSGLKFHPSMCIRHLCIVKLVDDSKLYLKTILPTNDENHFILLSPSGGISEPSKVEWASPVLSIRQTVSPGSDN
jgi:transcriptional regulator with XRE-family HTH domain